LLAAAVLTPLIVSQVDDAARRLQASKDAEARREAEKAVMAAFDKPKSSSETTESARPFGAVLRSASQTNTAAASPLPTRPSTTNSSAPATPATRTGSTLNLLNKFGSQSAGSSPSGGNDDEYEELDRRAVEAGKWVDKEIRKLIAEIQR
jgi:type II secretory pathway pseudopilin PulG